MRMLAIIMMSLSLSLLMAGCASNNEQGFDYQVYWEQQAIGH